MDQKITAFVEEDKKEIEDEILKLIRVRMELRAQKRDAMLEEQLHKINERRKKEEERKKKAEEQREWEELDKAFEESSKKGPPDRLL